MLPIKSKSKGGPSTDNVGEKAPPKAGESSTIACPDHLNIANLTVAQGLGAAKKSTAAPAVKIVGHKLCPEKGERVHICVRCNFPIAIYGRLSPSQHVFCLECAKRTRTCFLCEERIEKIHPFKLFGGLWICSAPQCLKSYLSKDEFKSHVLERHADLLTRGSGKEEKDEGKA